MNQTLIRDEGGINPVGEYNTILSAFTLYRHLE